MCGKFTQLASWSEIVGWGDLLNDGDSDIETTTPMRPANVIHLDEEGNRRVTRMRWGWSKPGPKDKYERPDHIHARAETIDSRPTFSDAFFHRRGILIVRTFNEGEKISSSKTQQHVITPKDGKPLSITVIWNQERREEGELFSFVMVTVPANKLISAITDRMPAIIQPDDWGMWLGEEQSSAEQLKALLLPFEGNWDMRPQEKAPKAKPRSPTDLF